jgi:hypothetical protein
LPHRSDLRSHPRWTWRRRCWTWRASSSSATWKLHDYQLWNRGFYDYIRLLRLSYNYYLWNRGSYDDVQHIGLSYNFDEQLHNKLFVYDHV